MDACLWNAAMPAAPISHVLRQRGGQEVWCPIVVVREKTGASGPALARKSGRLWRWHDAILSMAAVGDCRAQRPEALHRSLGSAPRIRTNAGEGDFCFCRPTEPTCDLTSFSPLRYIKL